MARVLSRFIRTDLSDTQKGSVNPEDNSRITSHLARSVIRNRVCDNKSRTRNVPLLSSQTFRCLRTSARGMHQRTGPIDVCRLRLPLDLPLSRSRFSHCPVELSEDPSLGEALATWPNKLVMSSEKKLLLRIAVVDVNCRTFLKFRTLPLKIIHFHSNNERYSRFYLGVSNLVFSPFLRSWTMLSQQALSTSGRHEMYDYVPWTNGWN